MSKTILITDDSTFMRMMLNDIVTKSGYKVVGEAKNGLECFEQYKTLKPDLVLCDITMPDYDGIWATEKITAYDRNSKIVMVSNMGQQDVVIKSIQAGAKDFIVKPFMPERVLEVVQKYLGA